MIAFTRVQQDAMSAIFARMASTQPNLYRDLIAVMHEIDRTVADAVVGEEDPETLLRRQGAARQWRALLVLASASLGPLRGDARPPMSSSPQV